MSFIVGGGGEDLTFWGLSEAANKLDTLVTAPAVCAVKTLQPAVVYDMSNML